MTDRPAVASVVLVAVASRQRLLAPSLRVVNEPVRYTVEAFDPRSFARRRLEPRCLLAEVVLIDGESVAEDHEREELLRIAHYHSNHLCAVLYLSTRLPSEAEAEASFAFADDVILPGWQLGDRLRRRVQAVALAPWRRSTALRIEAELRGDERLRLLLPVPPNATAPPPAACSEASPDRLASSTADRERDAFREGRRAGIALVMESVEQIARRLVDERSRFVEAASRGRVADVEAIFRSVPEPLSPVIAARYLGAVTALEALRTELGGVARVELARAVPYDVVRAEGREQT